MYGRVCGDTEEAWSLLTTVALTAIVYKDVTPKRITGHLNGERSRRSPRAASTPAARDAVERYIVSGAAVIGIT